MQKFNSKQIIVLIIIIFGGIVTNEMTSFQDTVNASIYLISNSQSVISAYRAGTDITQDYITRMQTVQKSVSCFLDREYSEMEFMSYRELGKEGATIEVMIGKNCYTFTCNFDGQIMAVSGRYDVAEPPVR